MLVVVSLSSFSHRNFTVSSVLQLGQPGQGCPKGTVQKVTIAA